MELNLNSATDWSIQDQMGAKYTVEQAKTAWDAGKVTEYNMAFNRLMQMNWDLDALKKWFADQAENWKARRPARH